MKKRTLLVSTAILLVAIMSLATASFAWFAAGSTATATDIKVTVASGSYLKIRYGTTGDWSYSASAGMSAAQTLSPASSKDCSAFFIYTDPSNIDAQASGAITAATTDKLSASSAETTRLMKSFQLKNAGADIPVKAAVTMPAPASGTEVLRSLRVGIVIKNGAGTVEHAFVYANTGNSTTLVANSATALVAPVYKTDNTTVIANMVRSTQDTDFDTTNDKTVEIYVWFEGQDAANTGYYAAALAAAAQDISVVFSRAESATVDGYAA